MTIFEPAIHELEQPDVEQYGLECCRFYVTEVTEVDGCLVVTGVDLDTFKFRSFVGGVVTKAVDDFRLTDTQNVWIIRPNRVRQLPSSGHPARDDDPQDAFETCRAGLSRETSCGLGPGDR